jgi:hypothetical protein
LEALWSIPLPHSLSASSLTPFLPFSSSAPHPQTPLTTGGHPLLDRGLHRRQRARVHQGLRAPRPSAHHHPRPHRRAAQERGAGRREAAAHGQALPRDAARRAREPPLPVARVLLLLTARGRGPPGKGQGSSMYACMRVCVHGVGRSIVSGRSLTRSRILKTLKIDCVRRGSRRARSSARAWEAGLLAPPPPAAAPPLLLPPPPPRPLPR